MPNLTVYALGEHGVNVVKSPIHLGDGELTAAQNARFNPEGETGGLQKRGGLTGLNAALAGGAVKGLMAVPLPDSDLQVTTLYAAMATADANTWYASTDGTTWTPGTAPADPVQIAKLPIGEYYSQRVATLGGSLYYPINGYTQYDAGPPVVTGTAPVLNAYDGTDDLGTVAIPYNPIAGGTSNAMVVLDQVVHRGALYLAVYDPGGTAPNHRGRVFKLDPSTGSLTQVGNRFGAGTGEAVGGMPMALTSFNGMLWAGTYGVSGNAVGRIYRIRPGFDETWTQDHATTAGQGYILSMASYKGLLYAATTGDAGSEALVKVRSAAGAWTASLTGSTTTGGHYLTSLTVFNDLLFCAEVDDAAGSVCLVKSFDGTDWATDLDVEAGYSIKDSGQTLVYGGNLYWVWCATGAAQGNADGFILKRTTAGTWSNPLATANLRGYLGKVVV